MSAFSRSPTRSLFLPSSSWSAVPFTASACTPRSLSSASVGTPSVLARLFSTVRIRPGLPRSPPVSGLSPSRPSWTASAEVAP